MSPSPNFRHQRIVLHLVIFIEQYLRENPAAKLCLAPSDVEFDAGNVLQPDVFYISNERLHIIDEHGAKGAPDFIAEIISPSTARLDQGPKCAIYARHGVIQYWAVHPSRMEIECYRFAQNPDSPVEIWKRGQTVSSSIFPGLALTVSDIFEA